MIGIQNVAASLHDVLLEQLEDGRGIFVLEHACKVAEVVELPLDSAREFVNELLVGPRFTTLADRAFGVAVFELGVVLLVEKASSCVAGLIPRL
jgi:hypothetical protein